MPELSVEVVRTIDQVDRSAWDALCHGRSSVDHRWLRLAESILVAHEPRYVLVRRHGRLEAAAICAIGRRFGNRALQRRLGWILRPFAWLRCSAPLASEAGIVLAPGSDSEVLAPRLLGAIRRLMLRERALFLTLDFASSKNDLGLWQHSQWTEYALDIRWPSDHAYLTRLSATDRRKIRRLLHRAERESITVERLPSLEPNAVRLRALIAAVLEHHGTHDPYVADLLPRIAEVLGDDLHVLAARQAGDIVGCVVLLRQGHNLVAKWIGLDYARTWGTSTYRLLVFESVRLAIDLGVRRLALGPTADEIKLNFGATPLARSSALTVLGPLPASFIGSAARLLGGPAAVDPTFSSAAHD